MGMALQCMSGRFPVRGMDIRFLFFVLVEDGDDDDEEEDAAAEALSSLSFNGNSFERSSGV